MALKQRKRFLIFYTFSFCLILGTTLIGKKKIKSTFHHSVSFAS
ncbi:hypothetical protein BOVAC1_319 [Bacteroides ovatus]|nr:hypothetical protein BOVAC1_319 [Bacteroides ovatus]CAG9893882.1 hypothetical protein BOVA514_2833 [Bacteroides ovatus]